MLAAVEASTGVRAEAVVGKPSPHMAHALLDRLGVPARDTLLTGATGLDEALSFEDRPDYILDGLAELLPSRDKPCAAAQAPENGED
jgi:hypothetical protein